MYAIDAYIGVVWGVNVGIYSSPMECMGNIYVDHPSVELRSPFRVAVVWDGQ